jgi:hypothetical protein
MTVQGFGRITPIQRDMLRLIGYRITRESTLDLSDTERMENMKRGREHLKKETNEDFGYDLAAWHEFLLTDEEYGYTHPYGFSGVKEAVEAALYDPEYVRVVSLLER